MTALAKVCLVKLVQMRPCDLAFLYYKHE